MAGELTQNVLGVVLHPRTAWSVFLSTAGAGASEVMLKIPWPKVAMATGFVFSTLLGIVQIRKSIVDRRISLLEEILLARKIAEDGRDKKSIE